jgi:TolA-binding protein
MLEERGSSERVETTIHGSTEARFERRTEGRVERVVLSEGTLEIAVRKLSPGERFLVATDDAEVEVRGTVFEIEAHDSRIVRVEVSEGKVEVRYRRGVSLVAAGGAWRPPMETAVVTSPPAHTASSPYARPVTSPPAAEPVASPPSLSASTNPSAQPVAMRERETNGVFLVGTASPPANASKAFGDAVDMLGRGDYAAARSQLDAFRAAHPADDRADLAAFLAIVSLQRAGRRSEAQEAARRYLELYPNGDRRADAARVAAAR